MDSWGGRKTGILLAMALWAGACMAVHPAGVLGADCRVCDVTSNQIVDTTDLESFVACVTGPGLGPPAAGCTFADLDQDGGVDQAGFGLFQACMGRDVAISSVFISEFMAEENRVLPDDSSDYPDWIEIYNSGSSAVDYPLESDWTPAHTGLGYDRNNPATYDPLIALDGDVESLIYGQSRFTGQPGAVKARVSPGPQPGTYLRLPSWGTNLRQWSENVTV